MPNNQNTRDKPAPKPDPNRRTDPPRQGEPDRRRPNDDDVEGPGRERPLQER
jgi:hypothetical protein